MPEIDITHAATCGPNWQAVAGPGRVFIGNHAPSEMLHWAIGDATAPTLEAGYGLPPAHGQRSGAEAIVVPAGRRLWVRSSGTATDHPVLLTVAALP